MKWAGVLLFVLAQVLLLLGVALYIPQVAEYGSENQFTLILVFAVVFLMTTLFILASGFSQLNLTDKTQPLGLPVGSVRSMIALILILVFIMFGAYLYASESSTTNFIGPIEMTKEEWLNRTDVLNAQQIPGSSPPRYNVVLFRPRGLSGQLAQQLLTTVGTLVVAVAGFYFGSAGTGPGGGSGAGASEGGTPAGPPEGGAA